jgi:uncharacterized repeat protein (TIGR01451 family)
MPCHRVVVLLSVALSLSCLSRAQESPSQSKRPSRTEASDSVGPAAQTPRVLQAYKRLPMRFEPNRGQADSRVKFLSRGEGYDLYLTPAEAVLVLNENSLRPGHWLGDRKGQRVIKMKLVGANLSPRVMGADLLPGTINYLIGNDPAKWQTNIRAFERVKYRNVYRGVDLVYHGNQRQLEYDLVISPKVNPKTLRLEFSGVDSLELDRDGNLLLHVAGGALRLQKPLIYQESAGARKMISGGYLRNGPDSVGFQINDAAYDRSKPLVIDPVLVYSTYLGGSDNESGTGIAVDASGNAYVTGFTGSSNFPLTGLPGTPTAFENALGGTSDAFVTKFDPTGSFVYSTYLGGSDNDSATGIAVDASGNAYITGQTVSLDFPTKNAFQSAFLVGGLFKSPDAGANWTPSGLSGVSIYAVVVNPQSHSTLYAGTSDGVFKSTNSGSSWAATTMTNFVNRNALVVDPVSPSTLYAGTLVSGIFKSTDAGATWNLSGTGLPQNFGIFNQIVCLAISPGNTSTLFAGITGHGLFKSTDGGATWSATSLTNAPDIVVVDPASSSTVYAGTSQGLYKSLDAGATWNLTGLTSGVDTFVISPAASTLYAGGSGGLFVSTNGGTSWSATGLASSVSAFLIDPVTPTTFYANASGGVSKSTDSGATWNTITNGLTQPFANTLAIDLTTAPAVLYAGTNASNPDTFIAKLNSTGTALLYSTYLGGTGTDQAAGIAIDSLGNAYVTGSTGSRDWPTTTGAFQTTYRPIFVAKLNPTLSGTASLVYSTFLGGTLNSGDDHGLGIAVDGSGNAYVTGRTHATNFPTTSNAFASTCGTAANCNGGQDDAFVTEINSSGSALVYSSYLGGSGSDIGRGIAVDSAGNIYVTGDTLSSDFPMVNPYQIIPGAGRNAFVSKFDPSATGSASLVYSTYLAGSGDDFGYAIAVNRAGIAHITGSTNSTNFPLANPTQAAMDPGTCLNACSDAFVAILNTVGPGASSLIFSTYLGGSAPDDGAAIAVDSQGSIYVTGTTEGVFNSTSPFPTTTGAFQTSFNGGATDAFVAKIAATGLSLYMTAFPNPVPLGTHAAYTLTVTNIGQNAFTGVTITDALPAGLTFVAASPSCTGTSNVTCSLGTLAANTSTQVGIITSATIAGQITNTASVSANEVNPNPAGATATAVVTVLTTSDLSVTMSANVSSVAVAGVFPDGGNLTYTITVANNGPDPAAGVTLTDTLPASLSLVSTTATQGACNPSGFGSISVICNLGGLASGAHATITISTTPSFLALGQITNTATVSASNVIDSNQSNNTASVGTTARNRIADLSVVKAGLTQASVGSTITYPISVTNSGPDPAGGVHMLDTLNTSAVTFNSASTPVGTCTFDGTTVDCDLGVLQAGTTMPVILVVTIKPGVSLNSQINNTARVGFTDLLGADADPDSTNNQASISTTVLQANADLSITKTVDANPVPVGGSLTYTISVMNNGPDAAPAVMVSDDLPSNVTLSSATPSQGSCSGTSSVRCQLGTVSASATATITIVVSPNSFGLIRNQASVTGNVNDSKPENDTTLPLTTCGGTPLRQVNIAILPVDYTASTNTKLPIATLTTQAMYVRSYYLQESMCAVQFNPTIITNPAAADGWWTLPKTEATYFAPTGNNKDGHTGPLMSIWTDAFTTVSAGSPAFLLGQKAGFFDVVLVVDTSSPGIQRSASLMNEAVRDHLVGLLNPIISGGSSVVAATIAGALAAVVAGAAGAGTAITVAIFGPFAAPLTIFASTLLAPSLPRVAVQASMFEQGSVVVSQSNESETWAHELGHGVFSFWDFYGDKTSFSTKGDLEGWDVMSNPRSTPPAPVGVYFFR